ncbi:MAG: LLM class flavin-dependent oxidoreductase [Pseudomonadales bacterium]
MGITPWQLGERRAMDLAAQARHAEALGYDSLWVPESHFSSDALPEPLLLLAAMAAVTERIRLGTTSYLLTLRSPLQAAEQVAVLDQLCGGRLILGVGRGFSAPVLRAFAVDPRDKRTLFETRLADMRRHWAGDPLDPEDPASARLAPLPLQQPHPPIWVAAFGPKALAQAGRLGLPYLASPVETLAELEANYALHRSALAEAGHVLALEVPVMRTLFVTRNRTETAELRAAVTEAAMRSGRPSSAIDVEAWSVIGEPGYVRERVAEYRERLGVSEFIVTRLRIEGVPLSRLEQSAAEARSILA